MRTALFVSIGALVLGAGCGTNADDRGPAGTIAEPLSSRGGAVDISGGPNAFEAPKTSGSSIAAGRPIFVRPIFVRNTNMRPGIANIASGPFGIAVVGATFAGTARLGRFTLPSAGATDILIATYSPTGALLLTRRYGDAADQNAVDLAVDRRGHIFLFGTFAGMIDFGRGVSVDAGEDVRTHVFVAKLDPEGRGIWARQFVSSETLGAARMALDPAGGLAITGSIEGTADFAGLVLNGRGLMNYIVKFDPDGNPVWGDIFRGPDQEVTAIDFDARSDAAVTEQDARGVRTFVLRWNAAGTRILDRTYAGTGSQEEFLYDMASEGDGDMFVVGSGFFGGAGNFSDGAAFLSKLDSAGDPKWIDRFAARTFTRIALSPPGRLVVTGLETAGPIVRTPPPSEVHAVAAQFTRTGIPVWIRDLGPNKTVDALDSDAFGNSLLAGSFTGRLRLSSVPLAIGGGVDGERGEEPCDGSAPDGAAGNDDPPPDSPASDEIDLFVAKLTR